MADRHQLGCIVALTGKKGSLGHFQLVRKEKRFARYRGERTWDEMLAVQRQRSDSCPKFLQDDAMTSWNGQKIQESGLVNYEVVEETRTSEMGDGPSPPKKKDNCYYNWGSSKEGDRDRIVLLIVARMEKRNRLLCRRSSIQCPLSWLFHPHSSCPSISAPLVILLRL
jgi:hypothetical protein